MTPRSNDTRREDTIRFLAHRLLNEQGWPNSGNFDDCYDRAKEICDAGLMNMAFGAPIPEAILKQTAPAPRRG